MVPPDRFPDVAKGLSEAPSRVAWLARRLTKLRRPAISKEEYYPNTTLERSANPATTYAQIARYLRVYRGGNLVGSRALHQQLRVVSRLWPVRMGSDHPEGTKDAFDHPGWTK